MSDLEKEIAEAQKSLDVLLNTPIEALSHWAKEHPKKFAALRYVLNESVNKNEIRREGQTRSMDVIVLSIDRNEKLYTVDYSGLVGYDDVTFYCIDALAAETLFEAFKNVNGVEAD